MEITWDRLRGMFHDPKPPKNIWQRQFDGFDDVLQRLAKTPWEDIDFSDLWYYHHDLAYVELQPDLFAYLFPVCLMDWHETLQHSTSCSHGDSDFHLGVTRGRVFEQMVPPAQMARIFDFFRDSFLARLDQERGFVYRASGTPAYGWMARFNSLGLVMPRIDLLWDAWWSFDWPGRAVAGVQYLSGLMYFEGENPLFGRWSPEKGGGGPFLVANDCFVDDFVWMEENVRFLRKTLNADFVAKKLERAVEALRGEPEHPQAEMILQDLPEKMAVVRSRVEELPDLLSKPRARVWTL